MRERFGSRLHLLVVAREEHTHVGADTGGHVEPCHRLFQSLGAASIGARDDDEIRRNLDRVGDVASHAHLLVHCEKGLRRAV